MYTQFYYTYTFKFRQIGANGQRIFFWKDIKYSYKHQCLFFLKRPDKKPMFILSPDRSGIPLLFSLKSKGYSGEQEQCFLKCPMLLLLKIIETLSMLSLIFAVLNSNKCQKTAY